MLAQIICHFCTIGAYVIKPFEEGIRSNDQLVAVVITSVFGNDNRTVAYVSHACAFYRIRQKAVSPREHYVMISLEREFL